MIRRLVIAMTAALCAAAAVPADAAAPVKLYLNQTSDNCNATGAQWAVTASAADGGPCIVLPRLQVDGNGYDAGSESFAGSKKLRSFRIDANKPLTGTFSLFSIDPVTGEDGVGVVAGDFVIKIGRQKVGTVHVEGNVTPATPVRQTFSLKLPRSLHNMTTNSVNVTHTWATCVGLCGVKVSGESFMAVPTR